MSEWQNWAKRLYARIQRADSNRKFQLVALFSLAQNDWFASFARECNQFTYAKHFISPHQTKMTESLWNNLVLSSKRLNGFHESDNSFEALIPCSNYSCMHVMWAHAIWMRCAIVSAFYIRNAHSDGIFGRFLLIQRLCSFRSTFLKHSYPAQFAISSDLAISLDGSTIRNL